MHNKINANAANNLSEVTIRSDQRTCQSLPKDDPLKMLESNVDSSTWLKGH